MLLVSIEVTEKANLVEKDISPKGLPMTSARRVAVIVLCSPRISKTPTKELAELLKVYEEAKTWASAGVLIIWI